VSKRRTLGDALTATQKSVPQSARRPDRGAAHETSNEKEKSR